VEGSFSPAKDAGRFSLWGERARHAVSLAQKGKIAGECGFCAGMGPRPGWLKSFQSSRRDFGDDFTSGPGTSVPG
jgi:hypothetical protein